METAGPIIINDWRIYFITKDKDKSTERKRLVFIGKLDSGKKIYVMPRGYDTINLLLIGVNGQKFALGTPNEDYNKKFPNTKNKIFQTFHNKANNVNKTPKIQKIKWWINAIYALASMWSTIRFSNSKK